MKNKRIILIPKSKYGSPINPNEKLEENTPKFIPANYQSGLVRHLQSKSIPTQQKSNENLAYVTLDGYKAYGILPTGHAGVVIKDDTGTYHYYDYGSKYTSKSGFTKLNSNTGESNADYRMVTLGKDLNEKELGDALGKYFPDNNSISFHWTSGDASKAIQYFNDRSANPKPYHTLKNNCSSEAECALEAAGVYFDGMVSSLDVPSWNTPENARKYQWTRVLTDEEQNAQTKFLQDLDQQLKDAQVLYDTQYKGKQPEEIRQIALERSRNQNAQPNTNFMTASDMMQEKRTKASKNSTTPYHNSLNTITGFFNPTQTVSSNVSFTMTPEAYGFQEISETEAQPGDIGILHNTDSSPYHAVMLDNKAADGSWNLNYSNGDDKYRHSQNISAFRATNQSNKLDHVKYYRYVGNNEGFINKIKRNIAPGLRIVKSIF